MGDDGFLLLPHGENNIITDDEVCMMFKKLIYILKDGEWGGGWR